jgi:L-ascorbate metabolism protein UlaG (beta-lactamase superfamily)
MRAAKAAAAILLICFGFLMVSGCASSKGKSPEPVFIETPTPTPTPTPFIDPGLNSNDTSKTIIRAISKNKTHPNNSYMIISQEGTVICADPTQCADGVKPDIITSTHTHPDHQDANLIRKFPESRVSRWTIESFEVNDVKVYSVAASHNGDDFSDTSFSNVIYVFEVDGLRIAHMGDMGQSYLTEEQLTRLGQIDVAFMQFIDDKCYAVIEQLKPQIIVPTHMEADAKEKLEEMVGYYEVVDEMLVISKDDLADGIRKVIKINNTFIKR